MATVSVPRRVDVHVDRRSRRGGKGNPWAKSTPQGHLDGRFAWRPSRRSQPGSTTSSVSGSGRAGRTRLGDLSVDRSPFEFGSLSTTRSHSPAHPGFGRNELLDDTV